MKLTYFPSEGGRGGAIRCALVHGDFAFEDEQVKWDQYQAMVAEGKLKPVGLPVLTLEDGRVITQSIAILRYVGKKVDMYPADADFALVVDEVCDICQDIMTKCPQDPDAEVKKKKREEYAQGRMKTYFDMLSQRLSETSGDFIAGPSLTIADLATFYTIKVIRDGQFDYVDAGYTDAWANLSTWEKTVEQSSCVQKYKAFFAK